MEPRRGTGRSETRWLRRFVIGLGAAAVLYLFWAIWDYEALVNWMENARVLPFFIAMALLPAIGVPATALFLLAGATFGVKVALLGTAVAIAINLALCYWIGHSRLRPRLLSLLDRFGYDLPDFDPATTGHSARRIARFTALVKLAPGVPGFIKNYGLGASRVPFSIYFSVSMLITGAYAIALIVLGDSLLDHELGRGALALLAVAALGLVLWWWSRRQQAGRAEPRAA